jgi:hypothetical protein
MTLTTLTIPTIVSPRHTLALALLLIVLKAFVTKISGHFPNLSSGGRLRPNSAARPLLDDAHTEGMGEDTGSATLHGQTCEKKKKLWYRRLQQQREAKLWKTWEESNMNDSFSVHSGRVLQNR